MTALQFFSCFLFVFSDRPERLFFYMTQIYVICYYHATKSDKNCNYLHKNALNCSKNSLNRVYN